MIHPPPRLTALCLLAVLPAAAWAQTTIVSYTFEGTTTPVIGAALSSVSWNSGAAEGYVGTAFSGLAQALSVGGFQIGEYYQVTLDATGYRDVTLNSFRSNGSLSAPADWKIAYSLTGMPDTFIDVSAYTLSTSVAVSLSTIAGFTLPDGADNNASIVLRFIATSSLRIDGELGAAGGTVRLDNLSFTATAIPEPSTGAAVIGLTALAYGWWWRRRGRG